MTDPVGGDLPRKDSGVLYIGIDLGTSRTSVAASNGQRETVWSYVGYAKDHISQRVLGADKLYGKHAVEKRLSLNLIRPFAEGMIKYDNKDAGADRIDTHLKAASDLVEYAISMCKPRADELLYGVIGAPAQASIQNQQLIIEAAKDALDAVMICSEPFAVAYGLDLLEDSLVVDIGAGTVDLCRLHGTMPGEDDQVTLDTAGDWLDQQLFSLTKQRLPEADFTIHYVKELKEKFSYVVEEGPGVEAEFLVDGKPTMFDITEEFRQGCRSIVPPIVESLHQLIKTFDPDFQRKLRDNVLLSGGGSQIGGLDIILEAAMKERLGSGRVTRVEEPQYAGANGALKMAHDTPPEFWKRMA
jgi:rod shape-determining protein MreB